MTSLSDLITGLTTPEAPPQAEALDPGATTTSSLADAIVAAFGDGSDGERVDVEPAVDEGPMVGVTETLLSELGWGNMRPEAGEPPFKFIVQEAMKRGVKDVPGMKRWLQTLIPIVEQSGVQGSGAQKIETYLRALNGERRRQQSLS